MCQALFWTPGRQGHQHGPCYDEIHLGNRNLGSRLSPNKALAWMSHTGLRYVPELPGTQENPSLGTPDCLNSRKLQAHTRVESATRGTPALMMGSSSCVNIFDSNEAHFHTPMPSTPPNHVQPLTALKVAPPRPKSSTIVAVMQAQGPWE